jgi:hypothetical protein
MPITKKQLEIVRDHYLTHTHKQIADMIGASHHAVRNACSDNGWIKRDDRWTDAEIAKLIAWYVRPGGHAKDTLRLDVLAKELGREKGNVCRKARTLGLTKMARPVALDESRKIMSERQKRHLAEHGHPRGALLLEIRRKKTIATNLERYGTASPVQAINKDRNVYSRCRRGVREDLGIFVRSRWEANYARYLKWLEARGDIAAWEYEPLTFRFEGVSRGPYTYKPDFKVVETDGTVAFHEVKGWMDSASRGKLKRFAKFYPAQKLVVIDQASYRSIARQVSSVIPNWEHE